MLNSFQKNQHDFGGVAVTDDQSIEIIHLRRASRRGITVEVLRFFRDILLMVALFTLCMVFLIQPVYVDGVSMVPQLENGDRLIVNKLVYYDSEMFDLTHVKRGDVVVFWYPHDPHESFVKRVIGLPGDKIQIRAGEVILNGQKLYEPYLSEDRNQKSINKASLTVPDFHYYVMGDNRDQSDDSRGWGVVPAKYIYGRVFFRYWPLGDIGTINAGEPYTEDEASELAQ